MLWLWYSLISVFLLAGQNLLMRILAVKTTHARIFSVVFNSWGAFFAIVIFALQKGSFAALSHLAYWQYLLVLIAIILYGLYERLHFSARQGLDASSLSIIFGLSPALAFIGSLVVLHEAVTFTKILGAILAISASFLLVFKNPKLRLNKGLGIGLLCAAILGVVWVIDKPASAPLPSPLYSFLMWCLPLGIVIFPSAPVKQIRKEFVIGGWRVALAALLNVVAYILYIQAFTLADASKVIPVTSTSGVVTVLGGVILLGEHDHKWRKYIAALLAFVGIWLLS